MWEQSVFIMLVGWLVIGLSNRYDGAEMIHKLTAKNYDFGLTYIVMLCSFRFLLWFGVP